MVDCEKNRKIEGGEKMFLRQFPTADCRLAKTFHMRGQNRVVAQMPRYTGVLTTDFK
jgi:hypothetical protein